MIDSTLTWHSHIENISKKMSKALGLLYKIRPFVNIKIMKTLYYALVYPHILYAIEVWGSAGITILNRLLVLQKRIVMELSNIIKYIMDLEIFWLMLEVWYFQLE